MRQDEDDYHYCFCSYTSETRCIYKAIKKLTGSSPVVDIGGNYGFAKEFFPGGYIGIEPVLPMDSEINAMIIVDKYPLSFKVYFPDDVIAISSFCMGYLCSKWEQLAHDFKYYCGEARLVDTRYFTKVNNCFVDDEMEIGLFRSMCR